MQDSPANASCGRRLPDLAGSPLGNPEAALHDIDRVLVVVHGRPVSPLTEIRHKQKAGIPLTEDEKAQVATYYSRYSRRKKGIHLKGGREQLWVGLAQQQGLSLSSWIQERVDEALHGNDEALQALREENQRLRDEVGALRGASGHLAVDNSRLQTRLEGLETSLMEAMEQALQLAGQTS